MNDNGKRIYIDCAYLILTENCNLDCVYCFEKDKSCGKIMELNTAKNTIDWLYQNAHKNNSKEIKIIFFGGEPMLCPELMIDILEYAYRRSNDESITPKFAIITNGTIWNDKVEKFFDIWHKLAGNNMNIQLSIDGIPDIQNTNRPAKGNKKSSTMVEFAVAKYREYFMNHDIPLDNIYIHACVSHDTIKYMTRSYDYFWDTLKVRAQFAWVFESNWDDSDVDILDEELSKLNVRSLSKEISPRKYFLKHFDKCSGCGSGRTTSAIDTKGNIYPCHRFYFYSKSKDCLNNFILGNVNNGIPINDDSIRGAYINFNPSDVSNQPSQICIACNYEVNSNIYQMPNDYQIKFMKIINKYFDEYKVAYYKANPDDINKDNKKSCKGDCKCHEKGNDANGELINKMIDIIEVMDNRISILESKLTKYEKLEKIWEVIKEDE